MFRMLIEPELSGFIHCQIKRIKDSSPDASRHKRAKEFADIADVAIGDLILVQDDRRNIRTIKKRESRGVTRIKRRDGTVYTAAKIGMTGSIRQIAAAEPLNAMPPSRRRASSNDVRAEL